MVGIKDFEMPSCCNSCEHWSFSRDNEPLCDLTYEDIRQFDKRQDDCPLVEAISKADYEARLTTDMATIKQLSNSIKVLQRANSEIAGAYDKLKADYENRLKADMVAILTEMQLEIEKIEMDNNVPFGIEPINKFYEGVSASSKVIQQKINSLKGEQE